MFKTYRENRILKDKVTALENDVALYKDKASRAEQEKKVMEAKYREVSAKNKEIKQLIRDQTDADLLINALKAIGVIGEKEKNDYRAEEQRLMGIRQMIGIQNPMAQGVQGLQGLFGGIF